MLCRLEALELNTGHFIVKGKEIDRRKEGRKKRLENLTDVNSLRGATMSQGLS